MFGRLLKDTSPGGKTGALLCSASVLVMMSGAIAAFSGCGGSVNESLWTQIKTLETQKTDLELRNESLQKENQQLKTEAATLEKIKSDDRSAAINTLVKIQIGKRSGLFDKDNNGSKESLVVYIEPVDSVQDTVKAPGRVDMQLWNLDANDSKAALLKEWTVMPDELQKVWASVLGIQSYRLSCPIDNILKGTEKNLTVKVKFTDYVTGKVLEAQHVID